jgi:hypothetical protein
MAKRSKPLPAMTPRDRARDDDSLLLRSAESLGRVIGALQRQLDGATRRLARSNGSARATSNNHTSRSRTRPVRKAAATTRQRTAATAGRSTKTAAGGRSTKKR